MGRQRTAEQFGAQQAFETTKDGVRRRGRAAFSRRKTWLRKGPPVAAAPRRRRRRDATATPPRTRRYRDVAAGSGGAAAAKGASVALKYRVMRLGKRATDNLSGEASPVFSLGYGEDDDSLTDVLKAKVGSGQLIPALDSALVGMTAGGKRRLFVARRPCGIDTPVVATPQLPF